MRIPRIPRTKGSRLIAAMLVVATTALAAAPSSWAGASGTEQGRASADAAPGDAGRADAAPGDANTASVDEADASVEAEAAMQTIPAQASPAQGVASKAVPAEASPARVTPAEATATGAAPAEASGAQVVQEVHVRGDRANTPGQTGTSVVQLSRKDVQMLPGGEALSLSQIMLTQPGFTNDTFGPDGTLHVRGEEAGLLYLVDGIPIPVGLAGQFVDVLPTGLVQSVRLITGGQPVEYGPNPGGVVDVATRHGSNNAEGAIQMVYGTYQKVQPSAWYSQTLGKADVFVSGTFLSTERGLDPPAVSPILHDRMTSADAFARIDYRPDDRQRIELLARYSDSHLQIPIDPTLLPPSDGPPNAMQGMDIYGNSPPQFVPYDANPTETERDLFAALSYSYALSNGFLQVTPYVRSSYGDLDCDPQGSLGPTAYPGSVCSTVVRDLLHEGEKATYAWAAGDEQRWKAGVDFDVAQSRVDYTVFGRDDGSPAGGPDPALTTAGQDKTSFFSGGAFVQDEITLGNVKLFPGLRADIQDASFAGTDLPNLVLVGPSARLGFSYSFFKGFVLHGFAGYLWQPPNAVDAAVAARALNAAHLLNIPPGEPIPVDLKAERDESVEIGLSYRLPQQFEASLTGYGRLSQDTLDVLTVGSTSLVEDYNYARGRAVGAELSLRGTASRFFQGFGNASWDVDQGQGIDSESYLFQSDQTSYSGWQTLDHVQKWTVNAGVDLHDESERSHLAVLFQYGSGLRTGALNNETVPGHATWNVTLRHRFDLTLFHPEVAIDVFNVFNAAYAIRIANGFVGSAYGALREVNLRLTLPFGS